MITPLDIFINEPLRIPNVVAAPLDADNRTELQGYIDRCESDLLTNSLDIDLYNTLVTECADIDNASQEIKDLVNGVEYSVDSKTVRWNGLKEYSFLPYFIYWKYVQKKIDVFTTMGVERPEAVNSQAISSISRATEVYREFLEKYQSGNAKPTILYRSGGVGIDYSQTMSIERSLYQYLCDKELDVSGFKFYDDINSYGI